SEGFVGLCLFVCQRSDPNLLSFPYTTLFRSQVGRQQFGQQKIHRPDRARPDGVQSFRWASVLAGGIARPLIRCAESNVLLHYVRSEEHTSELQSRFDLVCRLLLEKKNSDTEI